MAEETTVPEALAGAMQSLYAAAPEEFMATRSALVAEAKAAGEAPAAAEIGKLRKPSLAAWAVNLTARAAPEVVSELTELGAQMRSAQSRLDTSALSAMRGERDAAVDGFVRAAVDAAQEVGRSLSAAAQQDVRATAIAALADERASIAVTSGQLTRALSYSGFGEVDLAEAVARTAGGAILTILPGGRGRGGDSGTTGRDSDDGAGGEAEGIDTADAEGDEAPSAEALEEALADAEKALDAAQAAVDKARQRAEDTRERMAVVERQLTKAREADERALEAVTDAVRARKQAEAARHTAQMALDGARGRD